ncbi:MAG TPA: hypothetical protein VNO30_18670 [Kofleriaceae bacterium]|nr:hypothetical protein [Kofleriaceae bacterium]
MRALLVLICGCSSASSAPTPPDPAAVAPSPSSPASSPAPTPAPKLGDPAAAGRVIAAHVVAAVDDRAANERPVHARAGQRVTLHAAIVVEQAGLRTIYSDAPQLALGGKAVTAQPLARAPALELRWNRIEPAVATMSNGDTPKEFHFEPIDYRATPIDGAAGKASIPADVRPTLTPDHGGGIGTMRYQIVALQGDRVIASAGPEARRGKGSGGLTDAVLRVSLRRDDTFLGYMTELYNQPYIWASEGLTTDTHQSERLEGSDCADLMIYGQRRLGNKLAYTWTGALPQVTALVASGARGADGVFRDARGQPIPFPKIGDLMLFPRHVGALAADRGKPGILDDQDLMMHTLFDSPKEQAIGESGYADRPVEVRRFRPAKR